MQTQREAAGSRRERARKIGMDLEDKKRWEREERKGEREGKRPRQCLQMFVYLNKLWRKVTMLLKHLSNYFPNKKINSRCTSTLINFTTHTYVHTPLGRTSLLQL